ncbi:MAG: site-specific DNA-methyltransferase, partial [Candidatus Marinimicrobia bacterium]|nr:site-specific DNA-methyltransferase [Candidatus Neomarinimicrobiota bacterium]
MDGKSLNVVEKKLNDFKKILPEAFTEEKIDWEKLKAALGEDIEFREERYHLNWAGKSEAFRALQTPTTATLFPDKEESVNFDNSENLFIEGENLEVMKVLQKSYFGKIKMIYIDPPYNTGNDFIYSDKFAESREDYLKRSGSKDENGLITREGLFRNSKDSGHYHSNWLSMMYPRLFLARNLLREDGVIFVSIDDNEVHNMRMLMNEVFGEENFVETFVWRSRLGKGSTSKKTATLHEYIVCYSKNNESLNIMGDVRIKSKQNKERIRQWGQGDRREDRPTMFYAVSSKEFGNVLPIRPDGTEGRWRVSSEKFSEFLNKNLVVFEKQNDGRIEAYRIIPEGTKTETAQDSILDSKIVKTTAHGSKELNSLFKFNIFDYPKPSTLLKHIVGIITQEEIILDFFAGSSTTAYAVLDLNKEDGGSRKFIMV